MHVSEQKGYGVTLLVRNRTTFARSREPIFKDKLCFHGTLTHLHGHARNGPCGSPVVNMLKLAVAAQTLILKNQIPMTNVLMPK